MRVFAAFAFLVAALPVGAADYPKIELSTKFFKLTAYLPDAEKGFYRGSRFAWGGIVGDIEIDGMKLFQAWKDTHNPTNNDDIIGPVLEFGQESPLGYTDAKVGEVFVKIGVGELLKPKEEKYSFFTNYKVANPGVWKIKHKKEGAMYDSLEFRQTLHSKSGYSYHYMVKVNLNGEMMFLSHELINIGTKKIATNVYNHNFFNVDKQQVGPKYSIEFEHGIEPSVNSSFANQAKTTETKLEFPKLLTKEAAFGRLVQPEKKSPYNGIFKMTFRESDAKWVRVHVVDDSSSGLARSKFQVWAIGTVMCPEPFFDLQVEPGESISWASAYRFESPNTK